MEQPESTTTAQRPGALGESAVRRMTGARSRALNVVLTSGLDLALVAILGGLSAACISQGLSGPYLVLFFMVLGVSLLPLFSFFHNTIDSIISPIDYHELFAQTVDSILRIESFDAVLTATFDRILRLINVKSGMLIFFYHDRDEFNIFYQKGRRRRVIKGARIEENNVLFTALRGPDDIIVKHRLDPKVNHQREIVDELERLGGEVAIPIFYRDMFLGLILVGDRMRRFSPGEIRLLRIFASRIATLSTSGFFFGQLVEKMRLEKEFELASKVQNRFLPDADLDADAVRVRVHHRTASLLVREFYDVFAGDDGAVRISAYRVEENISGTSIYLPWIQASIHSLSRLGYPPSRIIARVKRIIADKGLMDEPVSIIHAVLRQNGSCAFAVDGYQTPLVYRAASRTLAPAERSARSAQSSLRLAPGDALLVACRDIRALINAAPARYAEIIAANAPSAGRVRSALVKQLAEADDGAGDRLLIVCTAGRGA